MGASPKIEIGFIPYFEVPRTYLSQSVSLMTARRALVTSCNAKRRGEGYNYLDQVLSRSSDQVGPLVIILGWGGVALVVEDSRISGFQHIGHETVEDM